MAGATSAKSTSSPAESMTGAERVRSAATLELTLTNLPKIKLSPEQLASNLGAASVSQFVPPYRRVPACTTVFTKAHQKRRLLFQAAILDKLA